MALEIFTNILKFLKPALWAAAPLFLFFIFGDIWLHYRRAKYINGLKWKVLELRIPKDVIKSPKAMEQVFAAAHNIWSFGINRAEKWWQGKIEPITSFELVGRGRGVHFFIKVQENFRNLIESAIYAQYPDAEISEVPDYVLDFPPSLPNDEYDVFGSDFVLAKEDYYPILTYPSFEDRPGKLEESRIDPIAQITEIMSNLKPSEAVWIQILARRAGDGWKKKAEDKIDEFLGKKKPAKSGVSFLPFFHELGEFLGNLFAAPVSFPVWSEAGAGKEKREGGEANAGKRKAIEGIENKISKLGFETVVRFVYVDRADAFSRGNVYATVGSFWQFSSQTLNAFKLNSKTTTLGKGLFRKMMARRRKRLIYNNYQIRHFPKKFSILNTEELATIYHPPLTGVKAARLQRTDFKRGGPPPDLPVEF